MSQLGPTPPSGPKPKAGAKAKARGRKVLAPGDASEEDQGLAPKPKLGYKAAENSGGGDFIGDANLVKAGQTISEALGEAAQAITEKLNTCYPGWTPSMDTMAEVHQHQQREKEKEKQREEKEGGSSGSDKKRRSSWGQNADELRRKSGGRGSKGGPGGLPSASDAAVDEKDKQLRKLLEHAGEPGSIFWTPSILQDDIQDHLESLHTDHLEELLTKQMSHLDSVIKQNSTLQDWLSGEEQDAEEMHTAADLMIEGLQTKIDKSGKKSASVLQAAQKSGKKMVAAINSALQARENIRKILLEDANIVITDDKKQLLEERRRQGQELSYTMIEIKKQEEEDGSGLKEAPQVTELKEKIAKKTKRHAKLKAESDKLANKLRALEQGLTYLENRHEYSNNGEGAQIDEAAMELIEEAKGIAREQILAPLLRQLEVEHNLHDVQEKELPQELLEERNNLEQEIAEVEAKILEMEKRRQDEESAQSRMLENVNGEGDESEQLLSELTAIRRRSSASSATIHVQPPMAGPMPEFDRDQVDKIQNSLKKCARACHKELAKLPDFTPKYLAIISNAVKSAEEISQQRAAFIAHVMSLKEPFMRDLKTGGMKDAADENQMVKNSEEALMERLSKEWDEEVKRLCAGHIALDKRCDFFKDVIADVQDELEKVQIAADKCRWAISDKVQSMEAEKASNPSSPAVSAEAVAAKAGAKMLGAFRNAQQKRTMSQRTMSQDSQATSVDVGGQELENNSSTPSSAASPRKQSLFSLVKQKMGTGRRTSMNFLMETEDEGELASESDMKAFLAFTEPDEVYFKKASVAIRLQDQKILQKYILEGEQAEAEAIAEQKRAEAESQLLSANSLAAHALAEHAAGAFSQQALAGDSSAEKSGAEEEDGLAKESKERMGEDEDDEEEERPLEGSSSMISCFSDVSQESPVESANKAKPSAKNKFRKVGKAFTLSSAVTRMRKGAKPGSSEAAESDSEAATPRGTPHGGDSSLFLPLEPLKEGKRARPTVLNTSRSFPAGSLDDEGGNTSEPSTPRRSMRSSASSSGGGRPSQSEPNTPSRKRPTALHTKLSADLGASSPGSPSTPARQRDSKRLSKQPMDARSESSEGRAAKGSPEPEGSEPATPKIKAGSPRKGGMLDVDRSPGGDSSPGSRTSRFGLAATLKDLPNPPLSPSQRNSTISSNNSGSFIPGKADADAAVAQAVTSAVLQIPGIEAEEGQDDEAQKDGDKDESSDEEDRDDDELKDVSDGVRGILQLDQTSRKLERQIGKLSERLTAMRKDLTGAGKEVFPLDLDRLKLLEGDEKTHQLARESVRDLKLNWQEILRKRKAAGKGYYPESNLLQADSEPRVRNTTWSRPKTEQQAFQDTYSFLMGEIENKAATQDGS